MAITITDECINCGACEPECPTHAIVQGEDIFEVDPARCTECVGFAAGFACNDVCPVDCCVADPSKSEPESVLLLRHLNLTRGEFVSLSIKNSHFRARGESSNVSDVLARVRADIENMREPERERALLALEWAEVEAREAAEKTAAEAREEAKRAAAEQQRARRVAELAAQLRNEFSSAAFAEWRSLANHALEAPPPDIHEWPDPGGDEGLHAGFARHWLGREIRPSDVWRPKVSRHWLLSVLERWPTAPDDCIAKLVALCGIDSSDFEQRPPEWFGSIWTWIATRVLDGRFATSEKAAIRILSLQPSLVADTDLQTIVDRLLGPLPRTGRASHHALWEAATTADSRVAGAVNARLTRAPSALESALASNLHRVGRTAAVCDPTTGEILDPLEEWEGWDPDDPFDDRSVRRVLARLPVTTVKRKRGRARPARRNPYNDEGIGWRVEYFEATRTARIFYTYLVTGDGDWEETKLFDSFEAAVEYARETAADRQADSEGDY